MMLCGHGAQSSHHRYPWGCPGGSHHPVSRVVRRSSQRPDIDRPHWARLDIVSATAAKGQLRVERGSLSYLLALLVLVATGLFYWAEGRS